MGITQRVAARPAAGGSETGSTYWRHARLPRYSPRQKRSTRNPASFWMAAKQPATTPHTMQITASHVAGPTRESTRLAGTCMRL